MKNVNSKAIRSIVVSVTSIFSSLAIAEVITIKNKVGLSVIEYSNSYRVTSGKRVVYVKKLTLNDSNDSLLLQRYCMRRLELFATTPSATTFQIDCGFRSCEEGYGSSSSFEGCKVNNIKIDQRYVERLIKSRPALKNSIKVWNSSSGGCYPYSHGLEPQTKRSSFGAYCFVGTQGKRFYEEWEAQPVIAGNPISWSDCRLETDIKWNVQAYCEDLARVYR